MRLRCFIYAAAAALMAFSCDERVPEKPVPTPPAPVEPEDPDPITMVTIPGAYGVEGGDVVFDMSSHQLSRLEYSSGISYRILNPEKVIVYSVSGLPGNIEPGNSVTFLYRVQEAGHSTVSVQYDMQVMQVKDGKAWLKKDDNTFFVILL